jgi:hypothetical protein
LRSCKGPICLLALGVILALLGAGARPANAAGEYPVKAAILFNFAQFVDWPASSFSDAKAPLIIGVLGEDPFNGALDRALAGKFAGDHPLQAVHFASASEISRCHILFVTASSQGLLAAAQQKLKDASVLTVGESEDFTSSAGGVARLYTEDNRIRIEINRTAANKAGLHISSKLLKLAKIVQ